MRGLKHTLDRYHGVDKGRENRKERLEDLPAYEIIDLIAGGFFVIHTDGGKAKVSVSENTVKVMKEMGVFDEN